MRGRQAVIPLMVILGFGGAIVLGWLASQLGPAWQVGIGTSAFIFALLAIGAARRTSATMRQVALTLAAFFSTALSAGALDMVGLWWAPAVVVVAYMVCFLLFPPWAGPNRRVHDVSSDWEPEDTEDSEPRPDEPSGAPESSGWRSAGFQESWDAVEHHQGIVVYPDKRKLFSSGILALAVSAGFVVLCIALTRNGLPHDPREFLVVIDVAVLVLLFFSFGVAGTCYRLLSRAPALVVYDQGIRDNISWGFGGVGMLPWEEIAMLFSYSRRSGFADFRFLAITPRDVEAVLHRRGPLVRALMKMSAAWNPAPVVIPQRVLPVKVDDLLAQIRQRYGHEINCHHVTIVAGD